jgi:predicted metal-dependent RNase
MTQITFLGGVREVGRSCFLLNGDENVLLDCGVKFGATEEYPLLEQKQIRTLNKVILSHAHLDHTGYAPALYSKGYRGKTFLTKPTRDIIQLLYGDYLRLAKERGNAQFTQEHVLKLLKNTEILEFEDSTAEKKTGISFFESGHILGSAIVRVNTAGHRVLYTGDLNMRETRLLAGSKTGMEADTLIIESTYGAKEKRHQSSKKTVTDFIAEVKKTLEGGGKVIVPSFAIGRGQEILFTIESFMRSKALPEVPIYLDGMVTKALRIYRHNAIYLKDEIKRRILTSDDDPFKSLHYRTPKTKDRSDVTEGGPCVIIATSGMLTGGPVMTYLEKLGPDPKNAMILVGYQPEGSRGRQMLDGAKEVEVGGRQVQVNMSVMQAPFSAHSDHDELLQFAKTIRGLKKVFVVHGEGASSDELAIDISRQCSTRGNRVEAIVPELGETHAI